MTNREKILMHLAGDDGMLAEWVETMLDIDNPPFCPLSHDDGTCSEIWDSGANPCIGCASKWLDHEAD